MLESSFTLVIIWDLLWAFSTIPGTVCNGKEYSDWVQNDHRQKMKEGAWDQLTGIRIPT